VIVSIDPVIEKKVDALAVMVSQFHEGGANGSAELYPNDPEKRRARDRDVRNGFARRNQSLAERFRDKIGEWYRPKQAQETKHIEAFELFEYGSQPNKAELKRLFPFFGE